MREGEGGDTRREEDGERGERSEIGVREFGSGKGGDASSFATRHNQSALHQYVP